MTLAFLHDHPELIPVLSELCGREWGHLYPGWNTDTARREFQNQPHDGTLPVTLIAWEDGQLLGTVSLIFNDLPGFTHLNPWLASLLVLPEHRGKGVAAFLIHEAEKHLAASGYSQGYLFTESAQPLFEKLGWQPFQAASCHGHAVTILRKDLLT